MDNSPAHTKSIYDSVRLPLGKTTYIRVIKIRPSTTPDLSDPIVCDFSILDVDNGSLMHESGPAQKSSDSASTSQQDPERVEYQALSYTWGHPTANQLIQLNGTPFRIRDNLWDFLQHARKQRITKYLWIDALSIDQSQVGERNHQVGMMGDIYSRAECVIIWLGHCSNEQRDGLEDFFDALRCSNQRPRFKLDRRHAMTAFSFMHLPYWRRAWIVQEYYLARRKVIWYGDFRLVQEDMKSVNQYFTQQGLEDAPALRLWRTQNALHSRHFQPSAARFDTFFKLLDLFDALKCADERDSLFALLPLLSTEERKVLSIDPDYSKSTTDLFVDVATILANASQRLDRPIPYDSLERMLDPDLQDLSVQSAILDLRALVYKFWLPDNFSVFSHYEQCLVKSQRSLVIGTNGCVLCHKKPFVFMDRANGRALFSKAEWQEYVTALLVSKDKGHRNLGAKYCRDEKLALGIDEDLVIDQWFPLGPPWS